MSEDPDFDMEVVEKDKLDEPRGNTEAGSQEAASSKSSSVERKSTDSGISKSSGGESAEEARVTGNGGGSTASPSLADSPDAWRQRKLGDLLSYEVSGTWGDDPDDGGGKPVLRATNFAPNSIDLGDVALRKISDSHRESKRLEEGDIVLERSGGSADQPVGRVLFFDLEGEYYPGNFLRLMRPDPEVVNRRYLYYYLDYRYKRGDTIPVQTNSTNIRNLQYTSYLNLDTQLPPLPEQRKIASVLYAVDQAIQKTEAIIEQAQRVKRGLMQRLFHHGLEETNDYQTTKYGSAPAHWEIKPISDLAIQVQAGGTPDTDREEFYDGKIPWIRTGELRQKRIRDPEKSITEAGFENSTARLFPKNTVLVAMYGATAGESAMLDIEATSNQACCGVITDEEKILPEFLFQQLLYLKENLIALGAGSGQQNISKGIISNFRVLVPQLEEQTEIASMLRIWDEEVEAGEKKREQLKRLKKGLMQDLLTGEVRTADKAIEVLGEVKAHG